MRKPMDADFSLDLSPSDIEQFIRDGYLKIEHAFSREDAEHAVDLFWRDLTAQGFHRDDASTWTQPVVRLGMYSDPAIVDAANSPRLRRAFDQLVGEGNWLPCRAIGTVPVRFPLPVDGGDTGWHVDASFGWEATDFMQWRINLHSRGRTLLLLMLFSDTTEADAPTKLLAGSHQDIARALEPAGADGLTLKELLPHFEASASKRQEVLATGAAGSVFLCHPFLVHAAQRHHGTTPRFLAQPPLLPRGEHWIADIHSATHPVGRAISQALTAP
jgi:Phytanoyl-CoA dioxygenase (PhyH).